MESLMAATVLGIVVLAAGAAISSSQRVAADGQRRMLGAMVVDDLMSELLTVPYDDLRLMGTVQQEIGEMQTLDGHAYPGAYWALGRLLTVEDATITHPELGSDIDGVNVRVEAFDEHAVLATIEMFVAEPDP
jgi:hypothetical protein